MSVAYSDPASGVFLGSPSIIRLGNGSFLASHDTFRGWQARPTRAPATYTYMSDDGGKSWRPVGMAPWQYWSTLFSIGGTRQRSFQVTEWHQGEVPTCSS